MFGFGILAAHTILFWFILLYLHKKRDKITLIPFYAVLSALTILTHVLSTSGAHVTFMNTFFLISSTAYFTPLLMGIYILYIIDGPAAARKAFQIIVGVSLLHVLTVILLNLEDTNLNWIDASFSVFRNYFFSILAIILDIIVIGIGWEFVRKIKVKSNFVSVSFLLFLVFVIDAFVFVTGVFLNTPMYWEIIKTDLIVRAFQSVIMGIFISRYLVSIKFSEIVREQSTSFWEIINFRSAEEKQITNLQGELKKSTQLTKELEEIKETYRLMLSGINVGVYQINYLTNIEFWSDKMYEILGYKVGGVAPSYERMLSHIHEMDRINLVKSPNNLEIEVRIMNSETEFRWYKYTRVIKFDVTGKKIEEIGSFVDIDLRKKSEEELKSKIDTLHKINKIMVNRELHLIDLKSEIRDLKEKLSSKQSK